MRQLQGQTIQGYEIHMGLTTGTQPWLEITQRSTQAVQVLDGSSDAKGQIWGCYIHGLFANACLRHAWLTALGWRGLQAGAAPSPSSLHTAMEHLADAVEASLDMSKLEALYGAVNFHCQAEPVVAKALTPNSWPTRWVAHRCSLCATAEAGDADMAQRIAQHRQSRPAVWRTLKCRATLARPSRTIWGVLWLWSWIASPCS